MTTQAPSQGRALVVGLGVSGSAAAAFLRNSENFDVTVVDDRDAGAVKRRAEEMLQAGIDVEVGSGLNAADTRTALTESSRLLDGVDLVLASPGVPPQHPLLAAARDRGIRLWSEIELGFRAARAPIVAVTGTNGKTTVATLLGEIFGAAGIPTTVCGNIGTPMISAAPDVPSDGIVVVEASSFQLLLTEGFRARAGVILNIAPDHLDWHPDLDDYAGAKARVWANQEPDDLSLANADDPLVSSMVEAARGRHAWFSVATLPDRGAGVIDGEISVVGLAGADRVRIVSVDNLPDAATHDVANAAACAAIALDLGVAPDTIAAALMTAERLPHRRELVREVSGVRFVDDSKATNPHAALAALSAYRAVVLIAGGRNKGLDLAILREGVSHLKSVVVIGEASKEISEVFEATDVPVIGADSMESAVRVAFDVAVVGDVVLLSPACASFDWYPGYAARGRDFSDAVAAVPQRGSVR